MPDPVDLAALDAAHAAATPGEWSASTPYREIDGSERCFVSKQNTAPIVGITITAETQFEADARAIAAYHNAYPAMAAELRALREVAEAARAFLPTCERVVYDGATTRDCGAAATHKSSLGVVLCDVHRSNVPGPLDPDPRVDALRAALARVPR